MNMRVMEQIKLTSSPPLHPLQVLAIQRVLLGPEYEKLTVGMVV
jgi:hypothetical protein